MLCFGVFTINLTARSQELQKYNSFKTGGEWLDANGVHIDCHGGNIIYVEHLKTYYWYGEHRGEPRGASCYSSSDLYNWISDLYNWIKEEGLKWGISMVLNSYECYLIKFELINK